MIMNNIKVSLTCFLCLSVLFCNNILGQGPVPFSLAPIAMKAQQFHDSTYFLQTTGWAKNDSVEFSKYMALDRNLDSLLAMANYMQILNKYNLAIYYEAKKNDQEAIQCYKEILRFPFWGHYHNYKFSFNKNLSFNFIFFELYHKSGRSLIWLYEKNKNLNALLNLNFVPASYNFVMPSLKSAIESLGGEWPYKDMIFDDSHLYRKEIIDQITNPKNIQNVDPPKKKN